MAGHSGVETGTGFRSGRYGQRALFGVGRMKNLKKRLKATRAGKKVRTGRPKKGAAGLIAAAAPMLMQMAAKKFNK